MLKIKDLENGYTSIKTDTGMLIKDTLTKEVHSEYVVKTADYFEGRFVEVKAVKIK